MIFKKFIAEAIGTFVLVFFACGVAVFSGVNVLTTALAFGLTIIALAYVIGPISGCHINPAVSLAMLINKKMSFKEFWIYVGAQVLGAILGAFLLWIFARHSGLGANAIQPKLWNENLDVTFWSVIKALIVEIILTFVFVLTILGVTSKKENAAVAGIVIGLTLTFVHLLGIYLTGTSVNPARSFGPALINLFDENFVSIRQLYIFIIGPLAGGALAAITFKFFQKNQTIE